MKICGIKIPQEMVRGHNQMSFKHVVGSNVFKNTENQFDKEWEWFTNQ